MESIRKNYDNFVRLYFLNMVWYDRIIRRLIVLLQSIDRMYHSAWCKVRYVFSINDVITYHDGVFDFYVYRLWNLFAIRYWYRFIGVCRFRLALLMCLRNNNVVFVLLILFLCKSFVSMQNVYLLSRRWLNLFITPTAFSVFNNNSDNILMSWFVHYVSVGVDREKS